MIRFKHALAATVGALALALAYLTIPAYAGSNTYAVPGVVYPCDGNGASNCAGVDANYRLSVAAFPYAVGAVPLTGASGDVAASNAVATLTAVTAKTTYITGFTCTSTGSTSAATVDVAVTGTKTGTLTYIYASVAGATLTNTPLNVQFAYPVPASATNTSIVVTMPSLGTGNLHAACVATGFNL